VRSLLDSVGASERIITSNYIGRGDKNQVRFLEPVENEKMGADLIMEIPFG
jgi:hypothetical protein